MAGNHYPRTLIAFLKKRYQVRITKPYPGIYYIEGLLFPVQILVQKELDQQENLWLGRLRQDLSREKDVKCWPELIRERKEILYTARLWI